MLALRGCPELLDIAEAVLGPEIFAHPQFALRAHLDEGRNPSCKAIPSRVQAGGRSTL
jgi:hypothetical protein